MVRPIHSMIAVALLLLTSSPAQAERVQFPICGSGKRITCMVDGDTLWYQGVKYRLEGIDAPEKAPRHKCMQEGLQARMATERLAETRLPGRCWSMKGWQRSGKAARRNGAIDWRPLFTVAY